MQITIIILDVILVLLVLVLITRLRVVNRGLATIGDGLAFLHPVALIGWILFFLVLSAPMYMVGGYLGFLLWLATIVIALMIANRYRESEWRMLYWSLGVAAERGIPLNDAARAFADERRDGVGRRARILATALESGMSLDDSLDAAGASLSNEALLAVRTSSQSGHLASSLKGAGRTVNLTEDSARATLSQFTYVSIIVCVVTFIVVFLMYKIVPEYIQIFDGHNMRLPQTTILMVWLAESLASPLFLWLYVVLFLTMLFLIARYIGLIRWDPPVFRRFTRPLDEAIVLRSLGRSVEEQQALPAAVAALAEHYPKSYIRARLDRALEKISNGADWRDSLQAAGLLPAVAANVLRSAERVDNLSWALNEMADRQVRRFVVRLATLRAIAFPIAILSIALVVAFIAVGMFLPLIDLIRAWT